MANANESDFFGESSGLGSSSVLGAFKSQKQRDDEEAARRARAATEAANTTATRNLPYGQERTQSNADQVAQSNAGDTHEAGNDWLYPALVGGTLLAGIGGAAAFGAAPGATALAPTLVGPSAGGVVTAGAPAATTMTLGGAGGSGLAGAAGAGGSAAASGGMDASDWVNIAGTAGALGLGVYDQMDKDSEKKLIAKQEQMAKEAEQRRTQMQTAGMNALGQRLLAFDPMNQMMASMFGPSAAFTPEQFAGMAENPMGPPPADPALVNYQGTDPNVRAQVDQSIRDRQEYETQEAQRRDRIMSGMSGLPQGPTPLKPTQVQPARRF